MQQKNIKENYRSGVSLTKAVISRQVSPDLHGSQRQGFTLIELLVVVLIIGILAAHGRRPKRNTADEKEFELLRDIGFALEVTTAAQSEPFAGELKKLRDLWDTNEPTFWSLDKTLSVLERFLQKNRPSVSAFFKRKSQFARSGSCFIRQLGVLVTQTTYSPLYYHLLAKQISPVIHKKNRGTAQTVPRFFYSTENYLYSNLTNLYFFGPRGSWASNSSPWA